MMKRGLFEKESTYAAAKYATERGRERALSRDPCGFWNKLKGIGRKLEIIIIIIIKIGLQMPIIIYLNTLLRIKKKNKFIPFTVKIYYFLKYGSNTIELTKFFANPFCNLKTPNAFQTVHCEIQCILL